MLIENIINLDGSIGIRDKVSISIQRLQSFEPPDGYWLAFSGGKDSVVLKALADMAGVKYDAHYNLTTLDPPELVKFIKTFPDVTFERPEMTMWRLMEKKGAPPLRMSRYCCSYLKEGNGKGRVVLTGVRWAESARRKANRNLVDIGNFKKGIVLNNDNDEARRTVEQCYRTQKTLVNPIIDWTCEDVWDFIRSNDIRYCSLYDEGWKRLGCIGCPMAGCEGMRRDFDRWPKYEQIYIHAFDRMIQRRKENGKSTTGFMTSGQACFDWWMGVNQPEKQFNGQMELDEPHN
jgi:phosphoadenosine phosphosulfate reductase